MKIEELKKLVGQHVYLVNDASVQMDDNKVQIKMTGSLEIIEEPETNPEFYLRVKEDGHGSSGISFKLSHVLEIYKQTYAYEICLK